MSSPSLPIRTPLGSIVMSVLFFLAMCNIMALDRLYCWVASNQRRDSGKILQKKSGMWKVVQEQVRTHRKKKSVCCQRRERKKKKGEEEEKEGGMKGRTTWGEREHCFEC